MRRKPGEVLLRVVKGALEPADRWSSAALREKGLKRGDIVAASLAKARNPGFFRKAHALATLLRENLDEFSHLKQHAILKRLQVEADICCEYMQLVMPGVGPVAYRIPQSLSFEKMEETDFEAFYEGICQHVSKTYWPSMSPKEIAEMAEFMPEAA